MHKATKRVNLLIIRGVFITDINASPATEAVNEPREAPTRYDEIPKHFTAVDKWPLTTNLKCWSCDLLPPGYPKFIPLNPEKGPENTDICDVYGNFCEWNCAVDYVCRWFPVNQQWDLLEAICLFESKFSGRRKEKIIPAPPKTKMAMYCGSNGMTPEEWRRELHRLNNEYNVTHYRLEHIIEGPCRMPV